VATSLHELNGVFEQIDALESRTKQFAVDVIRHSGTLPHVPGPRQVADQLARSAGSVGANHRAMRRARSRREFAAKLQIVVEEVDETVCWLEVSTTICPDANGADRLLEEARALRAIFVKARSTTRSGS